MAITLWLTSGPDSWYYRDALNVSQFRFDTQLYNNTREPSRWQSFIHFMLPTILHRIRIFDVHVADGGCIGSPNSTPILEQLMPHLHQLRIHTLNLRLLTVSHHSTAILYLLKQLTLIIHTNRVRNIGRLSGGGVNLTSLRISDYTSSLIGVPGPLHGIFNHSVTAFFNELMGCKATLRSLNFESHGGTLSIHFPSLIAQLGHKLNSLKCRMSGATPPLALGR